MLRLLHFADLHLDRAFGGQSYVGCDSAQRRTMLRSALRWAVDVALDREVQVVTIGGDLFELEHVTSDTTAFIARELSRLPCPVIVVSGNHDYSSPTSPYRTMDWPSNVMLALDPTPAGIDLGEIVIWALGYTGPEMDPALLRSFEVPRDHRKMNLLLVHGVDLSAASSGLRWGGVELRADEIVGAGFDYGLLGHIHQGRVGEVMSCPGSPVPLDAGEAGGNHGALLVEVDNRQVRIEALSAAIVGYETVGVDVGAVTDSTQLESLVREVMEPLELSQSLVTCRLFGRRGRALGLDPIALAASVQHLARGVRIVDASTPEVDLYDLADEPNVRGRAIAHLLADGSARALWAANLVVDAFEADIEVPA
jgi:exonuclease SbcD